jgi:hypothetical protein
MALLNYELDFGAFPPRVACDRVGRPLLNRSAIIGVVESPRAVPWTSPEDVPFRTDQPFPGWGATHPGGFNAAFANGSVRFLRQVLWSLPQSSHGATMM